MGKPLNTSDMNAIQLMRCPACEVAYLKRWVVEGAKQYCVQPSCVKSNHQLQHVNPFAIRRS